MAKYITPVPGGVGPMTVAMLMQNTVIAAELEAARILKMSWDLEVLPVDLKQPVPRWEFIVAQKWCELWSGYLIGNNDDLEMV